MLHNEAFKSTERLRLDWILDLADSRFFEKTLFCY